MNEDPDHHVCDSDRLRGAALALGPADAVCCRCAVAIQPQDCERGIAQMRVAISRVEAHKTALTR